MQNQEPSSAATSALQWKWVIIGVIAGAFIMGVIVGITAKSFHNVFIPSLIGSIGFVITGIVVGYYSPGVTIREAAVGGLILAVVVLFSLLTVFSQSITVFQTLVTVVFGYLLAFVGGWVGENLQEERAEQTRGMQWRWVGAGIVVALILNSIGVFVFAPLFNYNLTAIFVSFLVSFVIAGYVVGYSSAGVTIKEAAVAGLATVVIDWALVSFGLGMSVPFRETIIGLTAGFLLSMLGAWAGEWLQASMQKQKSST